VDQTFRGNGILTVRGFAMDRNAGPAQRTGVDRVQVYFNGDRGSGIRVGDAQLGLPDAGAARFGPQFANGGWQIDFQPTTLLCCVVNNQFAQITVYARSSLTGAESSTSTFITLSIPTT
jgi:hypothetical protein